MISSREVTSYPKSNTESLGESGPGPVCDLENFLLCCAETHDVEGEGQVRWTGEPSRESVVVTHMGSPVSCAGWRQWG